MFRNKPLVSFDQKQGPEPLLRTAQLAAGAVAFTAAHRYAMRKPGFADKAYNFFSTIEDRSPARILRTFGLSELYSSYLPQSLELSRKDLFIGSDLGPMGQHLRRMLGTNYDLNQVSDSNPMRFIRTENGSSYMKLEGSEHIQMRFFKSRSVAEKFTPGRIASSSQRLRAPLRRAPFDSSSISSIASAFTPVEGIKELGVTGWGKKVLQKLGQAQQPSAIYKNVIGDGYQPGAARIAGKSLRNVGASAERLGFLMGERAQTLMADVRLGLWSGSYNTLFHVPFAGGPNKGLVNELLTKRVLPIYAGITALGFADYLTHHVVSNTIINTYQKTRVAHAKLTDVTPARKVTDWYEKVVPGAQYGPLALPLAGMTAGAMVHYARVVSGKLVEPERTVSSRIFARAGDESLLKIFNKKSPLAAGLVAGFAAMLPFVPGMIGSRRTARELQDIYSGNEPVAVRSGRWWELGTTPWEGNRIKAYRPHWSVLRRAQAEKVSLYGSEKEYWEHNPLLHPIRFLRDPYFLEKKHYEDRPYPITSPAFSNVPLVGPILAATIGKLVKPPLRLHPEWTGDDYNIGSTRLQPRGPLALPPAPLKQEFGIKDTVKREALQFSEFIGLPGFIARTLYDNAYPGKPGKDVFFQGSRSMTSSARRYYEKELGAGVGPNADLNSAFGYTEPLRRFIQPEPQRFAVNDIPNKMPDWLPGEDYFLNFRTGDPYAKISEGYARLPGAGYEALHPELAGLKPEDYPDIAKLSILGDVAPYSVHYRRIQARVREQAENDTELKIAYEKIVKRAKAMKESVVRTDDRRFSREITKAKGTISNVTNRGIELEEYPGRVFNLSSVGYSAADQSAAILGEHNAWSTAQVAEEVTNRQQDLTDFFAEYLSPSKKVNITVAQGALETQQQIRAVFDVDGINVNKQLIDNGLGEYRKDLGGPESQAMFGWFGRTAGSLAEGLSFSGDESRLNPLRYIPTPYHTKLWQQRTVLAQYQQQEIEGTRLRRWQHPIEDFLMPYARGVYRRVVGDPGIPGITTEKRDLNTLADMLEYIRDMKIAGSDPQRQGRYTNQASRTAIGANLFGQSDFIASTFSGRDAAYFQRFLRESDPNERKKILGSAPVEMSRALSTQWVSQQAAIASASGANVPEIGDGGRLYSEEELAEYSKATTNLNYGDYQRSKEIAEFFSSRDVNLPDNVNSPAYDPSIDYEDVKLKIIQQEGYDAHDFGLFDDRAALLWRKPYIDGAVRELTGGNRKSVEDIRQSVEAMIIEAHDKNPKVVLTSNQSKRDRGNVRVDVELDQNGQLLKDMRRNPDQYQ